MVAPVHDTLCPVTNKYFVFQDPNFDPDAGADSAEVVADVIACQLTREYLDVVKALLTSGGMK